MNDKELRERIKARNLAGCYIFAGEEDYLKRYYLASLRTAAVSDETFATFNHLVLDGKEGSFDAVIEAIKAPPMMEDFKFIEWRYPTFSSMREAELTAFEEVIELLSEYDYAVLAFLASEGDIDLGTEKKPGKFVRRFGKSVNILNFPKSTDTQLISWLKKHFEAEGIISSRDTLEGLIFRSGRAMDVLANEVAKLSAYLKATGRDTLTPTDVSEVASSTIECDTYALNNAILERNKPAAFLALDEMKRERQDPTMILGMMARTYSELLAVTSMLEGGIPQAEVESATGMHPYKVKNYIRASKLFKPGASAAILNELSRVDVDAKYGGVSGYTAIEIFISKCL